MKFIKKILSDNLMSNLMKNASILLSGNFITQILGLITLILTTRLLGTELFGIFIIIQTYVLIVDNLLNFQSWQALIKYGVEALEKKQIDKFKGYIKFGTILDIVTAFLATILAIIGIQFIGPLLDLSNSQIMITSLYSLTILFKLSGTPTAILRIYDKFKLIAFQQVTSSFIKLTGIIIATILGANLWGVSIVWILTTIIENLLLLIFGHYILYKNNMKKWWHSKINKAGDIFRFTWWSNLTTVFDLPVKQFDMVIVSSVISFEAVAIYKIFKQVSSIIGKVAEPIFQAIYPQLVELTSNNELNKAFRFSIKSGLFISGILLPIIIIVIITSPVWLDLIFGKAYAEDWKILGVYLLLRIISTVFISIHPLFIAMGYVRKNIVILIFTNILYITAILLLGYKYGLMGVVLAYGVQFMSVVIWKILLINKKIGV